MTPILPCLTLVALGLGACADDVHHLPATGFQTKTHARPDQPATSSKAPCYCFPAGPECHYGPFDHGPAQAPSDVPRCPEGEACYANSLWYTQGFDDGPRGRCLRLCFHRGAEPTSDVAVEPFVSALALDCADTEECVLAEIDVGFERHPRALVGMCITPPPEGTIVTSPAR